MTSNIIHLLPDSVANQIAAGEVIQRPASVIKELMENAIDAGASEVKVGVVDAGRTLITVQDNGCGMNEADARLSFERHATSKISTAADLYALSTMGFRGEALASIAAIAEVELTTRQEGDELGVKIVISGSEIVSQEPCAAPKGSRFAVKNLFYNVPARRRFLKSDTAEMKHVCGEFLRVALAHPGIGCSLTSNSQVLYNLPPSNVKQRVAGVAGLGMAKNLIAIETNTSIVHISGFIGTPETARKSGGDQYFFANNRYMRSAYFNKAVVDAYKGIIAADHMPAYYIYMEVDPQTLDVNVHPQKTEIKFDDEPAIWKILNSTVSSCLNDNNILPSIDFDSGERIEIPSFNGGGEPGQEGEKGYNPFDLEHQQAADYAMGLQRGLTSGFMESGATSGNAGGGYLDSGLGKGAARVGGSGGWSTGYRAESVGGWEKLYEGLGRGESGGIVDSQLNMGSRQERLFEPGEATMGSATDRFTQYKMRYILTAVPQGLMIIDQHRASERVTYDKLKVLRETGHAESQRIMFPEAIAMGAEDLCIIEELSMELESVGLEVKVDTEQGAAVINSVPAEMSMDDVRGMLQDMTYDCRHGEVDIRSDAMEYMLRSIAQRSALRQGKRLTAEEMASLYERLMNSAEKGMTPSGKPTYKIVSDEELETLLRH